MSGREPFETSWAAAALVPGLGVQVSELVALADEGRTPMVMDPAHSGLALHARTTIDLHGAHVGRQVLLAFEGGDAAKPIVIGLLRDDDAWVAGRGPEQVEVDVDGQRMVVSAQNELVLRCGKASIVLTRAGKVLIQGTHVSSRSEGVNRIVGGSIQLN